jgi:hypothetical protein
MGLKERVIVLFRSVLGNFHEELRKTTKYSLTRAFLSADFRTFFRSNTKDFNQLPYHGVAIMESCDKFRLFFTVILTQPLIGSHTHSTTHWLSHLLTQPVIDSHTHSLTQPLIDSHTHSITHWLSHSFTQPLIDSHTHSLNHSFTQKLIEPRGHSVAQLDQALRWNVTMTYSFLPHYGPGVDSAGNRYKYQV